MLNAILYQQECKTVTKRETTVYPHDDKKYLDTKLTISNDFENELWSKLSVGAE